MATGLGTAIIDFGSGAGTAEASVTVTGQTSISATSKAEAYVMGDDTSSNHTALDHRWIGSFMNLTCGTPTAGAGFTIYATCIDTMTGRFTIRWIWAD